jgi:hypothetical protein
LTSDLKYRPVNEPSSPFEAGIIEDEKGVMHDGSFSFVFNEFEKEILEGTETKTTRPQEELVPVKKRARKTK